MRCRHQEKMCNHSGWQCTGKKYLKDLVQISSVFPVSKQVRQASVKNYLAIPFAACSLFVTLAGSDHRWGRLHILLSQEGKRCHRLALWTGDTLWDQQNGVLNQCKLQTIDYQALTSDFGSLNMFCDCWLTNFFVNKIKLFSQVEIWDRVPVWGKKLLQNTNTGAAEEGLNCSFLIV